jgi:hypothetical protein
VYLAVLVVLVVIAVQSLVRIVVVAHLPKR